MRTVARSRKKRQEAHPADSAARQAATSEILQVMYWLRGENIAQEVAPTDLAKWVGLEASRIEPILIQLLGAKLVERVVVDNGAEEGVSRFRLTSAGERKGGQHFAEEFAELTKPRHFEHSDPDCDCEDVSRFSVSLKKSLFRQLDEMIGEKGYDNRSLAIADMIRNHLVEHWQELGEIDAVGTVTVAYDPQKPHAQAALTELQNRHRDSIVSTLRVPIDQENCMEVLVLRGKAASIKSIADRLIAAKGVKTGKLSLSTTGKDLAV